jgi:ankyrin repeat protein
MAAQSGHTEVVKLLLKHRADHNKAKKDGLTPLYIAAQEGYTEVVELLLKNGASPNKTITNDGRTPLHMAAQSGHTEVVKLLLKHRADHNKAKKDGVTPLYIAAQEGHTEVVKLLLANRADPNKATINDGLTPLYIAAQEGHTEVVQLLLKNGADPNKATNYGLTSLHIATHKGYKDIVRLLLAGGANITLSDKDGNIARQYTKNPEIIDMLQSLKVEKITKKQADYSLSEIQNGDKDVSSILLPIYGKGSDDIELYRNPPKSIFLCIELDNKKQPTNVKIVSGMVVSQEQDILEVQRLEEIKNSDTSRDFSKILSDVLHETSPDFRIFC